MRFLDHFDMLFKEVAKVWGEGMVIMLCVTSELWSDFVVHINERDKKNIKWKRRLFYGKGD